MQLHIKSPGNRPGVYPIATRGQHLKYLSFTVCQLDTTFPEYVFESGDEELALDSYTGSYEVVCDGAHGHWSATVPARSSLRDPHPMVYLPAGCRITLRALDGAARISIGGALGKPGVSPTLIGGDQILARTVGKDNWTRTVFTHIADNVPAAHLICGETVNRPGGWSSCPPHKHDVFSAAEVPMEEVYYFQLDPPQGFGFIRVYTHPDDADAFDYAFPVEHGDTVLIPRGYHPVAVCPGYTLNYTWILAGEGRTYGAWQDDPRHAWIKNG